MSNEGVLNQVSVAVESEYGIAETPVLSVGVLPSNGLNTEQEVVGVEAIDTSPAQNKGFVRGVRNYSGGYEFNLYPNVVGFFLYSALGDVDTDEVVGETTVYEHVFTEEVAKPSLTVEQVIGGFEERYAGFIVSDFSLSFSVGNPVSISFNGLAKTKSSSSKIAPTYETLDVLKWDGVSAISIDGDDVKAYVESGNIDYANGLATFHGFNSNNEPSAHYVANSSVSGSFTMFLDGTKVDALKAKFESQDELPIILTIGGESIGTASNTALQVSIPRAAINAYVHRLATDYNQVTLDFVGGKDATDGLIEVTLINTHEAY